MKHRLELPKESLKVWYVISIDDSNFYLGKDGTLKHQCTKNDRVQIGYWDTYEEAFKAREAYLSEWTRPTHEEEEELEKKLKEAFQAREAYRSEWTRPTHEEEYVGMDKRYTEEKEDQAFEELEKKLTPKSLDHNAIESPSHYMFFDTEAINIIKSALTEEEFNGYLKGNALKYRLRCGKKDDALQDLGKAQQYEKMWEEQK